LCVRPRVADTWAGWQVALLFRYIDTAPQFKKLKEGEDTPEGSDPAGSPQGEAGDLSKEHKDMLEQEVPSRHSPSRPQPYRQAWACPDPTTVALYRLSPCVAVMQVDLDYTGISVSDPLMPGTGMDLMASFITGETLDRKFAAMICDQVRA